MHKLFLFLILFVGFHIYGVSQVNRFILLQTADASPFYIKLNKKILSSTSTGYLIIPKCSGVVQFSLGLANSIDETVFEVDIKEKDKGFLVKKMQDNKLALFDWQTTDLLYAYEPKKEVINTNTEITTAAVKTTVNKQNEDIGLEKMLQTSTGDNSISITDNGKKEAGVRDEKEREKEKEAVVPPTVVINKTDDKPTENIDTDKLLPVKEEPKVVAITDYVGKSAIKKILQVDNSKGVFTNYQITNPDGSIDTLVTEIAKIELVAVTQAPVILDTMQKQTAVKEMEADTIKKEIEPSNIVVAGGIKIDSVVTSKEVDKTVVVEAGGITIDSNTAKPSITENTTVIPIAETTKAAPVMVNSNCINNATDDDMLVLFATMAKEKDDDDKIIIAKKDFKKHCYTTAQVGNILGVMFTDKAKYELLYAAYPYVSNTDQYNTLSKKLEDSYYINLFNNMLRK
jgi:hypothetical protein